jgi:predicted short-subunit dehydrogenase-like oxidoreductase (DUF2520 family)
MIKVVILGAGNIAVHLYENLAKSKDVEVIQLYNRNLKSLDPFIGDKTNDLTQLKEADIYIITVVDDAVSLLSSQLLLKNKLVVHTSGSVSLSSLDNKNRCGVFYPLQSLSKEKKIDFLNIPICIEAENNVDLKLLETLGKAISNKIYKINSEQRKSLHLAAVFVNNFVNHMYYIGNEICTENNVPFDILLPLIEETFKKLDNLSPLEAQTGPAKRNDQQTIKNQLDQLKNSTHKEIYRILTKSIQETHGRKEL